MKVFLDTSALAKRYVQEPGSEELEALLVSRAGEAVISTLAYPEFTAALARKVRGGEIPAESAGRAMAEFERDWRDVFTIIPLTGEVAEESAALAAAHPLKGADAVQLGSGIAAGAELFVTADFALLTTAEKIGLSVYDPASGFY